MARSKEKLQAKMALLEKSLDTLSEALQERDSPLKCDAVIQRFEYVFELSWKSMRIAADYMGTLCTGPRDSIKAAYKYRWIRVPENWFEAMEARNKTSHTYNEDLAKEVFSVAKKFPRLVKELLKFLRKI